MKFWPEFEITYFSGIRFRNANDAIGPKIYTLTLEQSKILLSVNPFKHLLKVIRYENN